MNWTEIIDKAMIGTRGVPSPTDEWVGHTAEQMLLKQFALGGAMRRAGLVALRIRTKVEIDPAPTEILPVCTGAAIDWLKKVERSTNTRELIRDWGMIMMPRGKRVPHRVLPYILTLAASADLKWAPYLLPLIGARGRWLIEHTESYSALRQASLWEDASAGQLKPAELAEENQMLLNLRSQMIEGLAHE